MSARIVFQTREAERIAADFRAMAADRRRRRLKKFKVVLIDPPTRFNTWSKRGEGKSPQRHYPVLDMGVIASMPLHELVADDCAMFLWWTWPHIFKADRIIKGLGFEYSGLAWEWLKRNPVTGKYSFGGGYGTRKNVEPCLLARRGKLGVKAGGHAERDMLFAPRREHSRKPDEQYERIERMFDGPYLELFARTEREGWTAWGNETKRFPVDVALAERKKSDEKS